MLRISQASKNELTTFIIINQISSIEQNSAWNDASAQEVPDLEVSGENVLRLLVELRLVLGNVWWVEEIEERVVRHLLGDGANGTASLMLLLLLDGLHRDVLARLPVDVASAALEDLRPFERERLIAVDFAAQKVFLCEDGVGEVVVGREVKFQSVRQILVVLDFDVSELLQQRLIVRLNHVAQKIRVAKDRQPEIGNS